jgi:nucleoside-diphosphate-sugar epimerase
MTPASEPLSRVLVTGGSGFIGTNLVEHYRRAGVEVLNLDSTAPRNPEHRLEWQAADLLSREELARAVTGYRPTHVVHLAARTDLKGGSEGDYRANVDGVRNLLDAVEAADSVRRLIVASSRMVCRIGYVPSHEADYCPPNAYGASKVQTELIVRAWATQIPWVIVRPTSLWGPWFDVPYKDFFLNVARRRFVHVRGRKVWKSFGYVGNSVSQLNALLGAPRASFDRQTMYLADFPPLEVSAWANRVQQVIGSGRLRSAPYGLLKLVALAGDGLGRLGWSNPPLTSFRLSNLLTQMVYDLEPIRCVAPQLPYSIDEGIAETVGWLRERGEI